ncbi:MAG: hypothetical protein OXF78_11755 [Rhodospirillales bacterium]|nr:hypothetical protein [Rhodospirillales bacterium]
MVRTGETASAMHAKCVVIDGIGALVALANSTEAAQTRNIEPGLPVRAPVVAGRTEEHFLSLIREGFPERLPMLRIRGVWFRMVLQRRGRVRRTDMNVLPARRGRRTVARQCRRSAGCALAGRLGPASPGRPARNERQGVDGSADTNDRWTRSREGRLASHPCGSRTIAEQTW